VIVFGSCDVLGAESVARIEIERNSTHSDQELDYAQTRKTTSLPLLSSLRGSKKQSNIDI